jgi:hypothetical protein
VVLRSVGLAGPLLEGVPVSRLAVVVLALVLVAIFPDVAHACPVCFDSSDENRQAFITTTAFLSLLPLGMVGGAGLWIRKRSRELDGNDAE